MKSCSDRKNANSSNKILQDSKNVTKRKNLSSRKKLCSKKWQTMKCLIQCVLEAKFFNRQEWKIKFYSIGKKTGWAQI